MQIIIYTPPFCIPFYFKLLLVSDVVIFWGHHKIIPLINNILKSNVPYDTMYPPAGLGVLRLKGSLKTILKKSFLMDLNFNTSPVKGSIDIDRYLKGTFRYLIDKTQPLRFYLLQSNKPCLIFYHSLPLHSAEAIHTVEQSGMLKIL